LPQANQLETIPGISVVTAAVLTAFLLDIDRFQTPSTLLIASFVTNTIQLVAALEEDATFGHG
jgi:hypothetical protein